MSHRREKFLSSFFGRGSGLRVPWVGRSITVIAG